jgi:hypothetical protein
LPRPFVNTFFAHEYVAHLQGGYVLEIAALPAFSLRMLQILLPYSEKAYAHFKNFERVTPQMRDTLNAYARNATPPPASAAAATPDCSAPAPGDADWYTYTFNAAPTDAQPEPGDTASADAQPEPGDTASADAQPVPEPDLTDVADALSRFAKADAASDPASAPTPCLKRPFMFFFPNGGALLINVVALPDSASSAPRKIATGLFYTGSNDRRAAKSSAAKAAADSASLPLPERMRRLWRARAQWPGQPHDEPNSAHDMASTRGEKSPEPFVYDHNRSMLVQGCTTASGIIISCVAVPAVHAKTLQPLRQYGGLQWCIRTLTLYIRSDLIDANTLSGSAVSMSAATTSPAVAPASHTPRCSSPSPPAHSDAHSQDAPTPLASDTVDDGASASQRQRDPSVVPRFAHPPPLKKRRLYAIAALS